MLHTGARLPVLACHTGLLLTLRCIAKSSLGEQGPSSLLLLPSEQSPLTQMSLCTHYSSAQSPTWCRKLNGFHHFQPAGSLMDAVVFYGLFNKLGAASVTIITTGIPTSAQSFSWALTQLPSVANKHLHVCSKCQMGPHPAHSVWQTAPPGSLTAHLAPSHLGVGLGTFTSSAVTALCSLDALVLVVAGYI